MAVITVLDVRLQRRCFTVKFGKYLGTAFFTEQFQWLLQMLGFLGDFNNVICSSSGINVLNVSFAWYSKYKTSFSNKNIFSRNSWEVKWLTFNVIDLMFLFRSIRPEFSMKKVFLKGTWSQKLTSVFMT